MYINDHPYGGFLADYVPGQLEGINDSPSYGPLSAPVSNPIANPPQRTAPPQIAPIEAPVASQGMPVPQPYQPDPNLVQDAALFNYFAGMSGGLVNPNANPAQMRLNQAQQAAELQQQRMRMLAQREKQDNPFFEFEQAIERGYFTPKQGETMDQAFRRYTQERFKDPGQSVYSEKMTDLTSLMGGDRDMATKLEADLLEVREAADGSQFVYDKAANEMTDLVTPDQVAAGKALIASTETTAKKDAEYNAGFRAEAIQNLNTSSMEESLLQGALETSQSFLERFESGDLDGATGMLSGFFAQLGFGPEPLGDLSAQQVRSTLENLGITNLAPVTVREILLVQQMWADVSAGKDINVGRLKNAINNIESQLEDLEFERNRNLDDLKRYGRDDDYEYYYDRYGTVNNIEDLL